MTTDKNRKLWLDTRGVPVITTTKNGEANAIRWGWTEAKAVAVPDAATAAIERVRALVSEQEAEATEIDIGKIIAALDGAHEPGEKP